MWLLQSTTGRNIDLRIPSVDLRSHDACTGDYLEADMLAVFDNCELEITVPRESAY